MNLFILDKNYNKIGILSNQGVSPIAPFFDDKYTQELDTGADTYEFSTIYTPLTQELMEIGNHIIFEFNNEHKLFVIVEVEFSHKNGMHTIDIYAEGIGFELLEKYIDKFEIEGSYSNLLDIILVGTGWEHEVGRKVNDIKKMKYDGEKNILAIIQDSIKEYDGVEVKFEVDYSNNIIKKKVRVYENGGRGSHIGYRFEYGKNVSGITKKEVIADSKDDTVLFTNDNDIGILLEYSVDVAMRSEEIAQLEIGDTHYVIDHDFTPPLLITARIGKLEISFSDPTKNKVTLANFKGATGAISNKTHKGDVANIAENVVQTIAPALGDHDHDRLVCDYDGISIPMYYSATYNVDHPLYDPVNETPQGNITLETNYMRLNFHVLDEEEDNWVNAAIARLKGPRGNNTARIFTDRQNLLPAVKDKYYIGNLNFPWLSSHINAMYSKFIDSVRTNSYTYSIPFDREDMNSVSAITSSSSISKQDLLNFIVNEVNIYKYSSKEVEAEVGAAQPYLGILSDDFMNHVSETNCTWSSEVANLVMRDVVQDMDSDVHYSHRYNLPALVCALIGAFQQHVATGGTGGGGTGGGGDGDYITQVYADGHYANKASYELTKAQCNKNSVDILDLSSAVIGIENNYITKTETASAIDEGMTEIYDLIKDEFATKEYVDSKVGNGGSSPGTGGSGDSCGIPAGVFEVNSEDNNWLNLYKTLYATNSATVVGDLWVLANPEAGFENGIIHGGRLELTGDMVAGTGYFNTVDATKIKVTEIEFPDKSKLTTANGVSRSIDNTTTIEALQEEIRAKDEQIANLEDRLAKIEAMLGINND